MVALSITFVSHVYYFDGNMAIYILSHKFRQVFCSFCYATQEVQVLLLHLYYQWTHFVGLRQVSPDRTQREL